MEPRPRAALRTRGAAENPPGRFERMVLEPDPEALQAGPGPELDDPGGEAGPGPATEILRDPSRSILSHNESPDIGFDTSLNPYRGCEHGCAYCYARPTHEYLGFSAGLDFETRILARPTAPELLRRTLSARGWRPRVIALSGVTDCYQPVERRLGITRRCLEVLVRFRNPVTIVTKSALVTRDADLLAELAGHGAASVSVSITTLDAELQRRLEPRAARPELRLRAIERLAAAGVPVGVMVAPVIPGLTDHEIPRILEAAARAGAGHAGRILLRLPHGLRELFTAWLDRHAPERRQKVLNRLRSLHGGRLYDPRFGARHRGSGVFAEEIAQLFRLGCERTGLSQQAPPLSCAGFRPAGGQQLGLL